MKATPRQNAVAALLMLGVLAAVGARLWASRAGNETLGPENVIAAGGRVYVQMNRRLYWLDDSGSLQREVDLAALGFGKVFAGFQLLRDGQVLIGDVRAKAIRRCDLESLHCERIGPTEADAVRHQFKFFLDETSGRLYITDGARHRLLVQDPQDGTLTEALARGTLRYPNDVWLAPDGDRLYVADTNHHRLAGFAVDGGTVGEQAFAIDAHHPDARSGHSWPLAFAGDEDGWWVLDADGMLRYADLVRYDAEGRPAGRVALPAGADPQTLAWANGRLLVTDRERVAVYTVDPVTGTVADFGDRTFAGVLTRVRDRRRTFNLVSTASLWLLGGIVLGGFGLAVSVVRANRRGSAGVRRAEPFRLVPASQLPGVRWVPTNPKAFKQLRTARWGLVAVVALFALTAVALGVRHPDLAARLLRDENAHMGLLTAYMMITIALLVWLSQRLFRHRIGVRGSLLCLADHRGRVLQVPPEELYYTERAVSYGRIFVPLKTGHGVPVFDESAFERDIRPLLERGQQVGEVNMMVYQLMNGQPFQVTALVLGVIGFLLVFAPQLSTWVL